MLNDPEHLNTPRLVADAGQTTVWRWDQAEPFGVNAANEDPDGNTVAFDLPLRLPGQYFDKETGLHQNYFRDYDPSLGRYVESDPIGLRGGLNTYAYVASDPLFRGDLTGLQAPNLGRRLFPNLPPILPNSCGVNVKVPNFTFTVGVSVSFDEACQKHDACYSRCRASKGTCDQDFLYDMFDACGRVPMGTLNYLICRQQAYVYREGVRIGGEDAFIGAQKDCKGC